MGIGNTSRTEASVTVTTTADCAIQVDDSMLGNTWGISAEPVSVAPPPRIRLSLWRWTKFI